MSLTEIHMKPLVPITLPNGRIKFWFAIVFKKFRKLTQNGLNYLNLVLKLETSIFEINYE